VLYRSWLSGLKLRFDVLNGRGPENIYSFVSITMGWKFGRLEER